ncbi:hypothetical protein HDU67_009526 [Dinochytrium kinnereticum]|nr:hypothetical protein HDU67_009526 [Dinochytrium kinnereticum]
MANRPILLTGQEIALQSAFESLHDMGFMDPARVLSYLYVGSLKQKGVGKEGFMVICKWISMGHKEGWPWRDFSWADVATKLRDDELMSTLIDFRERSESPEPARKIVHPSQFRDLSTPELCLLYNLNFDLSREHRRLLSKGNVDFKKDPSLVFDPVLRPWAPRPHMQASRPYLRKRVFDQVEEVPTLSSSKRRWRDTLEILPLVSNDAMEVTYPPAFDTSMPIQSSPISPIQMSPSRSSVGSVSKLSQRYLANGRSTPKVPLLGPNGCPFSPRCVAPHPHPSSIRRFPYLTYPGSLRPFSPPRSINNVCTCPATRKTAAAIPVSPPIDATPRMTSRVPSAQIPSTFMSPVSPLSDIVDKPISLVSLSSSSNPSSVSSPDTPISRPIDVSVMKIPITYAPLASPAIPLQSSRRSFVGKAKHAERLPGFDPYCRGPSSSSRVRSCDVGDRSDDAPMPDIGAGGKLPSSASSKKRVKDAIGALEGGVGIERGGARRTGGKAVRRKPMMELNRVNGVWKG